MKFATSEHSERNLEHGDIKTWYTVRLIGLHVEGSDSPRWVWEETEKKAFEVAIDSIRLSVKAYEEAKEQRKQLPSAKKHWFIRYCEINDFLTEHKGISHRLSSSGSAKS
jgi:hypothetical protein